MSGSDLEGKRKTREMPEVVYNGRKAQRDVGRHWKGAGECGRGLDVTVCYSYPHFAVETHINALMRSQIYFLLTSVLV